MTWQQLGSAVPRSGNRFTLYLGRALMHLSGWRLEGAFPDEPRVIVAVAPHSSNFDFVLTVLVIWGLGLRASYLAKRSLFRFPLGLLMTHFGGIPVDRNAAHGLVDQLSARFAAEPQLVLGITPEGTRRNVHHWKSGFALIAMRANVPVVPAVLDYEKKLVRFCPPITDVADADRTLALMQAAAATGAPRRRRQ